MELAPVLNEYRSMVEPYILSYVKTALIPAPLQASMLYSLEAGGKRLRPCMTLAACRLAGGDVTTALPIAGAIEMLHTYSLIHDDLPAMDNDDFRRGKPSHHKAGGEATAILAGDALLSSAFELMLDGLDRHRENEGYFKAVREVARAIGATGMIAGQMKDIKASLDDDYSEDTLRSIHKDKTGALIRASVLAGAYVGGADSQWICALMEFGDAFGMLFQITDDILDCTGDINALGKSIGKDAKTKKLTYVTLFGLEQSRIMAENAAERARKALYRIDGDTEFFSSLIGMTMDRKY